MTHNFDPKDLMASTPVESPPTSGEPQLPTITPDQPGSLPRPAAGPPHLTAHHFNQLKKPLVCVLKPKI
ncbi:MAG TPA: hypothetical protein PLL06_09160 [Acidobacteriota bacterium]|nr:hypothetical protein [Acidobacteriota bacterium]